MFERKYKQAMNTVTPSENALNNALNCTNRRISPKGYLRILIAACLTMAILCTSIFITLKISRIDPPDDHDLLHSIASDSENTSSAEESYFTEDGTTITEESSEIVDDSSAEESSEIVDDSSADESSEIIDKTSTDITSDNTDDSSIIIDPNEDVSSDEADDSSNSEAENNIPESFSELGFSYAENLEEINEIFNANTSSPSNGDEDPESSEDEVVLDIFNTTAIHKSRDLIFLLNHSEKKIVGFAIDNGSSRIISEIDINDINTPCGILLIDNTMAVFGFDGKQTHCRFYDIGSASSPKIVGEASQSGKIKDFFSYENRLFIITEVDSASNTYESKIQYPLINGEPIDYRNVILLKDRSDLFTIITAYDTNTMKTTSELAILGSNENVIGGNGFIYHSNEHIYITFTIPNGNEPAPDLQSATALYSTKILKFSIKNGRISVIAAGFVDGLVVDESAIKEANDRLGVISRVELLYTSANGNQPDHTSAKNFLQVYTLNGDLEALGISQEFAANRSLVSMDINGSVAYVRTYSTKNSYELFAVDFSDPTAPALISELEDFGRFDNIHNYGTNHLLALSIDKNGKTGITNGLELALYDFNCGDEVNFLWEPEKALDKNTRYFPEGLILDHDKGYIYVPFLTLVYDDSQNLWMYEFEYITFMFNGEAITDIGGFGFRLNGPAKDMRCIDAGNYLYFITCESLITVSATNFSVTDQLTYEKYGQRFLKRSAVFSSFVINNRN